MRRTSIAAVLAALVLLVVVADLTGSNASSRSIRPTRVPITAATLVCPQINGSPPGTVSRASIADLASALSPPSHSAGKVTATVLAGRKSTAKSVTVAPVHVIHSASKQSQQVEIDASGSVAATLAGDVTVENATGRSRAMSVARCVEPATDWWFTGADGRIGFVDLLVLANPSPTAARVAVSLWGQKGPHDNTQLQSVPIGAHRTVKIPIASAAPDVASVAVHVHATTGTVTAALLEHRTETLLSNGSDFIPAANAPATTAVVPGFAPGDGPRYLIVTAPGTADATVNLRLETRSGTFQPSGVNQVVVRAGHTRPISVSAQLGKSGGAALLTSDQPVIASGLSVIPASGKRPDLMWSAAIPPLHTPAGIGNGHQPDGGHTYLYLSAPDAAASVKVTAPGGRARTIAVPAKRSTVTDITATIKSAAVTWPFVVTPLGSAPVYGVVAMSFAGAHGSLAASEPLIGLPTPIPLPPVREDARVAVS
ncbi:MAG: hypothetical protein JO214_06935 [Frankiaceae bacterium]|nr:hypothetical protein [Frankiaceae bacterium]